MKIQDLSKDLDSKEMTEVSGGDNGNSSASTLLQAMGIDAPVAVAYGAGSAGNTFVNVNGSQDGSESTHQTSGDKYAAWLGTLKSLG